MKANFHFTDGYAVVCDGVRADLHNDYNFDKLLVDWQSRTVTLTWHRASGEWVCTDAPRSLQLTFSNVVFMLVNFGGEHGDSTTVDAVGYIRSEAPAAEQGYLPDQGQDSDHLVLMWDHGGFLRIFAENAVLEVIR